MCADKDLEEEPGVDGDDLRLARSELAVFARVLALEHPVCDVVAGEVVDTVVTIRCGQSSQHR